jgi:hypothetical protein
MARDETAWTWWTLPPAIAGCIPRVTLWAASLSRSCCASPNAGSHDEVTSGPPNTCSWNPGTRSAGPGLCSSSWTAASLTWRCRCRLRIRPADIAECDRLALAARACSLYARYRPCAGVYRPRCLPTQLRSSHPDVAKAMKALQTGERRKDRCSYPVPNHADAWSLSMAAPPTQTDTGADLRTRLGALSVETFLAHIRSRGDVPA